MTKHRSRAMEPHRLREREARRHSAIERGRGIHYKLGRILDMYEEGFTDAEIGEAIGWDKRTVTRYRQVLQLCLGRDSGGRWSSKGRAA